MMAARIGSAMLDKAVFGREPAGALHDMSIEELEARLRVMQERVRLARWGGRALGVVAGALGGARVVTLVL